MKKIIIIAIALALIAFAVFSILTKRETVIEDTKQATAPTPVVRVGDLSSGATPIVAYGQVVSSNSVAVVPETSGVVKRVYKTLGQTVRAGETVVELQNSSEQQAVLQAQSSLSSAQASLERTLRGANDDQVAQAQAAVTAQRSALAQAETSVLSGLDGLYSGIDSLVVSEFGEFFSNPDTSFPSFNQVGLTDSQEQELEEKLESLNITIDQDRKYSDPQDALEVALSITEQIQEFAGELRSFVTAIDSPSISDATIDSWNSDLLNTRNNLESNKVTISSLRSTLVSAQNNLASAQVFLNEVEDGADSEDVTIAQSGVSANRAGLSSAQIQLQKTLIKAPTFGRISSIETRIGELVGPSAPIFIITSNDARRVDVNLTEKEVARVAVGARVVIDGVYEGTVARIAPSIDQSTGKVKVEIFPNEAITLTEGAGVGVSIETVSTTRGFSLPIESVFVRGDNSFVYKVQDGKAVPSLVETDGLFGPTVVVTAGLDVEDMVVTFARAIKDNQQIEIQGAGETQEEGGLQDISTSGVELIETQ